MCPWRWQALHSGGKFVRGGKYADLLGLQTKFISGSPLRTVRYKSLQSVRIFNAHRFHLAFRP
ncbi:hypothetical protein Hanom_Chr06g00497051 [Helianthus anomalus]